jgi:putative DNA primase/helicase
MSAAKLARALGGHRVGRVWMARCPAHDDRTPSLSIRDGLDGTVLVHCFAGCPQARVIASLPDRALWPAGLQHRKTFRPQPGQPAHDQRHHDTERTTRALVMCRSATPAHGTLVETYLRSRGIVVPIPAALRFHSELPHPSGGNWPSMIAVVTSADEKLIAIHRTFLSRTGAGKAPVEPERMTLGRCCGGAVRLGTAQPDQWLAIGEGIETTLTVMQACSLPGWAALSANGIRNLILPREARMVLICADNDVSGTGQRAAYDAADRFLREGRRVRVAMPPVVGSDFNDVLISTAPTDLEGEARNVA